MEGLIVTAALIFKDGKILIARRLKGDDNSLLYEFPGGTLKENETLRECLKREIKEELNIEISVGDVFEAVYYSGKKNIILISYLCSYEKGEIKPLSCESFKFIEINELKNYDFSPADIPIVKKMLKEER